MFQEIAVVRFFKWQTCLHTTISKNTPICRYFLVNLLKILNVAFQWNNCKKAVLQKFCLFYFSEFCVICAISFAKTAMINQIEIRKSWKYFQLLPYTEWIFYRWNIHFILRTWINFNKPLHCVISVRIRSFQSCPYLECLNAEKCGPE